MGGEDRLQGRERQVSVIFLTLLFSSSFDKTNAANNICFFLDILVEFERNIRIRMLYCCVLISSISLRLHVVVVHYRPECTRCM